MTKKDFLSLVKKRTLILDGATGSNLQNCGMPTGVCPEKWTLENPDALIKLQKEFKAAGSDIVYASTFTANRIKLAEYGLENEVETYNRELVAISKSVGGVLVAGDLTMTGRQIYPIGDMRIKELIDVYRQQARAIADAGADLFVVETMMSLEETRAAVLAIRDVCDLPIMTTLTFEGDGRTLFGTDPASAAVVLESLGVDAVGLNCSLGPEAMGEIVKTMAKYANLPIIAKPNAGMPVLENGESVYKMTPEEFALKTSALVTAGASIVGGCCGSTPAHIKALVERVRELEVQNAVKPYEKKSEVSSYIASPRQTLELDIEGRFYVIGERINPTGKKKLQASLREGSLELVEEMARQQEENGADMLDVNFGMNGIDEKSMMVEAIHRIGECTSLPLVIDSSSVDVMEAALLEYPGRALINSVSLEKEKFERLLPMVKKYGAMFIILPLSDEGLPKDMEEKREIIERIYDRAISLGLKREDMVVDALVATVGANERAALEAAETIEYCRNELGVLTSCGLSNISFGLPERMNVNAMFLSMCITKGLNMAIVNPGQDPLMTAAVTMNMLCAKPDASLKYIERMEMLKAKEAERLRNIPTTVTSVSPSDEKKAPVDDVQKNAPQSFQAVVKGSKNAIIEILKAEMDEGAVAEDIINDRLIPAINKVGNLFNEHKYFIPQLMNSAKTMEAGIEYLKPFIKDKSGGEKLPAIVIATVEGDIHDIGKNLVAMMLKNYGYEVYDLGKNVPADEIIAAAREHDAKIIALSALMTTTMMKMGEVVAARDAAGIDAKVIIGGACVNETFCEEISADGYSEDAAECVELVKRLLE